MEPERPCKHPCGVSAAPGMPMLLYLGPPGARELGVRQAQVQILSPLLTSCVALDESHKSPWDPPSRLSVKWVMII